MQECVLEGKKPTKRIKTPKDMTSGSVHNIKYYGDVEVVHYEDSGNVLVRFINTGYEVNAQAGHIRRGIVKDKLARTVSGVGFIGEGLYKAQVKGKQTLQYQQWSSMIRRCYNKGFLEMNPTYQGCTVHEDWHNFQNFAHWFDKNYVAGWDLDKDIKVDGNRVYSTDTCLFVPVKENAIKAQAKHFNFISPDGELTEIYNLKRFCSDNNLGYGSMQKLIKREGFSAYKGWKHYKGK